MNKDSKRKSVLFWDIEMNPAVYYGWNMRYEPFYQVEKTSISCIAYKWQHEDEVRIIHLSKTQFNKNPRGEMPLIKKMSKIINEADIMIAHNGDGFDWKKFNARVLKYNLPPLKKPKLIDTLKMVRSQMAFDSHKLGELCKEFKVPLKIETERNLFVKALNDWNAYERLTKYCVGDVIALEAVYNKLKPYCKPTFHVGRLNGLEHSCASCGSEHLIKFGTYITATAEVQRYRCKDCKSTATIDTASKKKQTRGII